MNYKVQLVVRFMKDNLHKRLRLTEMAGLIGQTPEHFCRMFKAETGMAPMKYLKRVRMEKAQELLMTTSMTVKEIVMTIGATDESHFRRDFKHFCGMTPAEYKARSHLESHTGDGSGLPA